jgi:enoyl-CoA hydratase/carnithine racemase
MSKLTHYQNKYSNIKFRREDGILEMAIHFKGGPAKWNFGDDGLHLELGDAFYDVGRDRDNKVVIFTGTGDNFLEALDGEHGPPYDAIVLDRTIKEGKDLIHNLLDIEVPVISAVNGKALMHGELPLLADVVIASDTSRFTDGHFSRGAVPGDGAHVLWTMWLGPNRGRYFLMTGQQIDAKEALQLGLVGEVVPLDRLLGRAWELAREMLKKHELVRRYTHVVVTQHLKRRLLDDLGYGLTAEMMAFMSFNKTATRAD